MLITQAGIVKLTDFGSSKRFSLETDVEITKSLKGSPYWMAPEVVNKIGHSYSADIWSLGCVVIEMTSGFPPWSMLSRDAKEVLKIISHEANLPEIPKCSKNLHNFIDS